MLRGKCHPANLCCAASFATWGVLPQCQTKWKHLNKLVFLFLMNCKPEALKRESLLSKFVDGGLNIVDIKTKVECIN